MSGSLIFLFEFEIIRDLKKNELSIKLILLFSFANFELNRKRLY